VTLYYVDPVNGLDTNNGLGPDASNATNKPWKTVGKGLLSGSPVVGGDTIYLAPGVYRQQVTFTITSPSSQVNVIGDPQNSRGFKTAAGAQVPGGPLIWTGHTTNDTTSPANNCMDLSGRSNFTFQNIMFVTGFNFVCLASTAVSQNIQFINCAFLSSYSAGNRIISVTAPFATALNWVIDRCIFLAGAPSSSQGIIALTLTLGAGADYDINFVIKNSRFIAAGSTSAPIIYLTQSGSGANKGNGVKISNCSFFGGTALMCAATNISSTIPSTIVNSFLMAGTATALNAGTAGQITEDYNLILALTARNNVTAGAHSISSSAYAPMVYFGQEYIWGMAPRPFGEPMAGSPLFALGNDGTQTNYDLLGRPRPLGSGIGVLPAVGALERGNSWTRETATVRTGPNAISCVGPALQDFFLPVEPVSTTVTVYMRYDATYNASGSTPQFSVLNGEEAGVAAASVAMVGGANNWEQLTLTFTPARQGVVTLRLSSYDTNGAGHVYADDRGGW